MTDDDLKSLEDAARASEAAGKGMPGMAAYDKYRKLSMPDAILALVAKVRRLRGERDAALAKVDETRETLWKAMERVVDRDRLAQQLALAVGPDGLGHPRLCDCEQTHPELCRPCETLEAIAALDAPQAQTHP